MHVRKRSQILGTLTSFSLHIHVFKQTVVWCGVHEPVDLANASRLSSADPDVRGFLRKRSAHTCANVRTTEQKLKRKAGNVTLSDPSSLSFLRRQKERAFAVPPAVVSLPSSGFAITPHTHAQYSHPGSSHERSETTTDARSGHKPRPNRDFFFLIPTSIASHREQAKADSPPRQITTSRSSGVHSPPPLPHFDAVTVQSPEHTGGRLRAPGRRAPQRRGVRSKSNWQIRRVDAWRGVGFHGGLLDRVGRCQAGRVCGRGCGCQSGRCVSSRASLPNFFFVFCLFI